MKLSDELTWRGLVHQTTYKELSELDNGSITFYWGVDPSADSMTVGNLAAAMLVKRFIASGYKAVLLIGGATGLIGDPDGKSSERELITEEELTKNKAAIVAQYEQIFGHDQFELVDNHDWFKGLEYLDFLRSIGKHIPMRQMLARDFVAKRLGDSGISYAEFSYVLIQAYDFLHLNETKGVSLQVSGADQWGNSIAGVDLIRRKTNKVANVLSTPLIVDNLTGAKFGKSETGAIWLDPKKTSPTQFYQFWINTADSEVKKYLCIFTELDQGNIEATMTEQDQNPGKRLAQTKLAEEVTKLVHGEASTASARTITEVLTGKADIANIDEQMLGVLRTEIPSTNIKDAETDLAEVLVSSQLVSSKTEARQLINSGAIYINDQKVSRPNLTADDFKNGRLIIRKGKAYKDSCLVELG